VAGAVTRERRLTITLLLVSALLAAATVSIGTLLERLDAISPRPDDRPIVERAIETLARSSRTPVSQWRDTHAVVMHLPFSETCVDLRPRRRDSPDGTVCFGENGRVKSLRERIS
jgi:hypothetical protein